jgi:hypothetical protein
VVRTCGGGAGPALLFFRGLDEGLLLRGVGEETGDKLVGELCKDEVDLRFQLGEGGRIASQVLGPGWLLGGELLLDVGKGLTGVGYVGAGVRIEAETHGKSFRVKPLLLR